MAWFTDITYVNFRQGWLYLAFVMDIWSRQIVGWAMGSNITAELADDLPKMALTRSGNPSGYIRHSDNGSQNACTHGLCHARRGGVGSV